MMLISQQPLAVLLLEDGTRFEGRAFGARTTAAGTICYHTGMTGYEAIVQDTVYSGQLVVMTMPHIGNGGVQRGPGMEMPLGGLVVKKYSEVLAGVGDAITLGAAMEQTGVPGISDIDTRMLTRHLVQHGTMRAVLDTSGQAEEVLQDMLQGAPAPAATRSSRGVQEQGPSRARYRIAVASAGPQKEMAQQLQARGCMVRVFPYAAQAKEVLDWKPDGIVLGNGPSDLLDIPHAVELVSTLQGIGLPVLGVGLGHQLLALANSVAVERIKLGHRGNNHPVRELHTGKGVITGQDSALVVDREQVQQHPRAELTHEHANDHTVMGVRWATHVSSVQYRPEGAPGPLDSLYLFDRFLELVEKDKRVAETVE